MPIYLIDTQGTQVGPLNPRLHKFSEVIYDPDCQVHVPFNDLSHLITLLNSFVETEDVPMIETLPFDQLIKFFNLSSFLDFRKLKRKLTEMINTKIIAERLTFSSTSEFQSKLFDSNDFDLFVEQISKIQEELNQEIRERKLAKQREIEDLVKEGGDEVLIRSVKYYLLTGNCSSLEELLSTVVDADLPKIFMKIFLSAKKENIEFYLDCAIGRKSYKVALSILFEITYLLDKEGRKTSHIYNKVRFIYVILNYLSSEENVDHNREIEDYISNNRMVFTGLIWFLCHTRRYEFLTKIIKLNKNNFPIIEDLVDHILNRKHLIEDKKISTNSISYNIIKMIGDFDILECEVLWELINGSPDKYSNLISILIVRKCLWNRDMVPCTRLLCLIQENFKLPYKDDLRAYLEQHIHSK